MKIVCYYNKNLKMSEGKLASQIGHVCKGLARKGEWIEGDSDIIVVLGLRQSRFNKEMECTKQLKDFYHVQKDLGITEVESGTVTAFGYIE